MKRHCEDCTHYAPARMTCTMTGKDVAPGFPECYWFDERRKGKKDERSGERKASEAGC